jgi:hypothetical protein
MRIDLSFQLGFLKRGCGLYAYCRDPLINRGFEFF